MCVNTAIMLLCLPALGVADADGSEELKKLCSAMRENEALYADLEIRYRRILKAKEPPPKDRGTTWRRAEDKVWVVSQSPWYFCRMEHDWEYHDGKREQKASEYGFDGEWSRMNYRGEYGNIVNGPVLDVAFHLPHRWGIVDMDNLPLVDYFEWSPTLKVERRLQELCEGSKVQLLGEEDLDGLQAIKVRFEFVTRGGRANNRFFLIWIVPDRNYLPARSEQYLSTASDEMAEHTVRVLSWREALPGIWMPERCEAVLCDVEAIRKGQRVVTARKNYYLDSVQFSPNRPTEFFRNVEMPVDNVVYTVVDGEIVKEEWPDEESHPPGNRRRIVFIVAMNLLVLVAVLVLAAVRVSRRRRRISG